MMWSWSVFVRCREKQSSLQMSGCSCYRLVYIHRLQSFNWLGMLPSYWRLDMDWLLFWENILSIGAKGNPHIYWSKSMNRSGECCVRCVCSRIQLQFFCSFPLLAAGTAIFTQLNELCSVTQTVK